MIAPTHMAFGGLTALLLGAEPYPAASMAALGSLLPDVDTQNSMIGRMVPGSWWLESRFGHREFLHSLTFWLPLLWIGLWFPLMGWIVWGAISHTLLDTLNIWGVRLFWPSHRLAVFGGKNMRFRVGSPAEMVFLIVLMLATYGVYRVQEIGGFRAFVGFTGAYQVAANTALKAGLKGVEISGTWRKPGGQIVEDLTLLVIGKEGNKENVKLALWDVQAQKVVRPFQDLHPLHTRARVLTWEWHTHFSSLPVVATGDVFYYTNYRWGVARAGDWVMGVIKWR